MPSFQDIIGSVLAAFYTVTTIVINVAHYAGEKCLVTIEHLEHSLTVISTSLIATISSVASTASSTADLAINLATDLATNVAVAIGNLSSSGNSLGITQEVVLCPPVVSPSVTATTALAIFVDNEPFEELPLGFFEELIKILVDAAAATISVASGIDPVFLYLALVFVIVAIVVICRDQLTTPAPGSAPTILALSPCRVAYDVEPTVPASLTCFTPNVVIDEAPVASIPASLSISPCCVAESVEPSPPANDLAIAIITTASLAPEPSTNLILSVKKYEEMNERIEAINTDLLSTVKSQDARIKQLRKARDEGLAELQQEINSLKSAAASDALGVAKACIVSLKADLKKAELENLECHKKLIAMGEKAEREDSQLQRELKSVQNTVAKALEDIEGVKERNERSVAEGERSRGRGKGKGKGKRRSRG